MSDSKELILTAATKLFLQKNYKEVTMKDIVEKTGLSKGAFYHYFESKEQLFKEVIQYSVYSIMTIDFCRYSQESLRQFYRDYLDDQYTMAMSNITRYAENNSGENGFNYFLLMFDAVKIFPEFLSKIKEVNNKEIEAWAAIAAVAKKNGEIVSKMSDEQIGRFFHHIEQGMSMQLVIEERIQDWKKEVSALWDAFYEDLKA